MSSESSPTVHIKILATNVYYKRQCFILVIPGRMTIIHYGGSSIYMDEIWTNPRPRIYRLRTPDFFALLFMLYSTAAYVSYKFEREIQIQSNDLNSLAASIQETLLGEHFQRHTWSIN